MSDECQCIKTGANVIIAGRYCHGDLFRFGTAHFMRVSCWSYEGFGSLTRVHAVFNTYYVWFGRDDEIATVMLRMPEWFDYNGRLTKE